MKYKDIIGFYVFISEEGTIGIEQHSHEFGKHIHIYLTLDQFRRVQRWVDDNELEIDALWNGGVENEPKA